ncbi:SMI1/KNR4 family protein [Rhodocytophaga rosea]|uniref:SMI1/KNR4 family protein n=1 Tax=Rhodocytophaga rosea TaxID=2704465 RepID=A0A6C0GL25_9BACT|nr:SMI1/KNR4 family protein [Rhodocytophaga rosea]QHT68342.1 SMI1/KNR4 family protein [Rhodocytophaga rosea]
MKAIISVADGSESPEVVLEALQRFIETEKPVGYALMHPAVGASLLAAKMNLQDKAEYFIKLWGKGYLEYWSNSDIAYLMRDRTTALLLIKGLLAPILGITKERCQKETQEILEKLSQRITHGRTLVYKYLSWKQLLNKISKLAIKQKTVDFSDAILSKKSLSRAPATIYEITDIERRLNILFPDDYKNFLLTSNGFECYSPTGVTLAPIDKVDFLTSFDKQLVDTWTVDTDDINADFNEKLKSSIIIGGYEEEQQLLLIPLKNGNWECWHFSSWQPGEVVYQSFRFYMEHELQELEDGYY